HQDRKVSAGGVGASRASLQADTGQGSRPIAVLFFSIRPPSSAPFWAFSQRRWSENIQEAPLIASSSPDGRPPRSSSTTLVRRRTRSSGISIRTGQTSKHAPHSDEA